MAAKQKSHSGAKKRFKKTASGLLKHKKSCARHLNYGKGRRRLRRLKAAAFIHPGLQQRIDRLLPYGTV